jgi:ribonuclease P protein component
MLTKKETFGKTERLCSKKAIEALFENGKSFYCPPFLIVWAYSSAEIPFPAQVAFSVSKKGFRLAVTRNLIKRRIREAYRKNKKDLYGILNTTGNKLVFTMIFRGNSVPDYITVESAVKEMIKIFAVKVGETKS